MREREREHLFLRRDNRNLQKLAHVTQDRKDHEDQLLGETVPFHEKYVHISAASIDHSERHQKSRCLCHSTRYNKSMMH